MRNSVRVHMEIYEPREDSFLLLEQVKKYSKGKVLDIGTGTGIQAVEAAKKADSVLAVDINREAINYCKKKIRNEKIRFIVSDLFSNIKGKFDLIIFNPPYLPFEPRVKDIATDGGKQGYETTEKFLDNVDYYLNKKGKILLLFSSLTNKNKINEIIKRNKFTGRLISKQKLEFEELYVYLIERK